MYGESYEIQRYMAEDVVNKIYENRQIVETIFNKGSYLEIDNGYIIFSESPLPESPKLAVYETPEGLHIEGRGNYFSEEKWLDITVNGKNYLSREKSFKVTTGNIDPEYFYIYKESDRLVFELGLGLFEPPMRYTADKSDIEFQL